MGRKIPAKKHRGVKDPLVQQARRLQSIKSKINAPPKDPDEQPIPKSLTRLFAFQNKDDTRDKPDKKKKVKRFQQPKDSNGSGAGDNPISRLRQLPGESGRGFSLRINSAIRSLHGDVTAEDYPQDLEEDDVRGERMADLRERRAKKRRRATGGKQPERGGEPHLTRGQKLTLKKKAKKEKTNEAKQEKAEVVYERVAFGDISHAPPALHFKNRKLDKNNTGGAPRPGRRDLLLTKMLAGGGGGGAAGAPPAGAADALRRERARLDAVQAYRAIKAAKLRGNKHT